MTTTDIRFKALPRQMDFLRCPAREVLYSGGYRAGKSFSVCLMAVMRASSHKGAREALVRKELVTLKATTLRTLLKGDGLTPPILPEGSYTHNKAEKIIALNGGGEIVYFGLDDSIKIGSYTLSGIGVDEVTQLTEDEYDTLRGRVSLALPGLPGKMYGACNPAGPHHYLAQRFGLSPGYKPRLNCVGIRSSMLDNARNLDPEYIADAMTWTGIRRSRYVEGQWVASDGLIYDAWDPAIHERTIAGPWSDTIIGVDEGSTHPFAALRCRLDPDRSIHFDAERYGSGLTTEQKIAYVRDLCEGQNCTVIYDAAAAGLGTDLRAAGFHAVPCDKSISVNDGIRKVQDRISAKRISASPECRNFLMEISAYEWDDKSTKERPKNGQVDHALDSARYLIVHLDRGPTLLGSWIGGGDADPKQAKREEAARNDDHMWETLDLSWGG